MLPFRQLWVPGVAFTAKAAGRKNNRSAARERMPRAGWRGRPRGSDGAALTESQRRRVMSQSTSMPGSSKARRELRFSSVACAMLGWHATSGRGEERQAHASPTNRSSYRGQREKCKKMGRGCRHPNTPPLSQRQATRLHYRSTATPKEGSGRNGRNSKLFRLHGCTYRCPS